jgi:hypothetical protein
MWNLECGGYLICKLVRNSPYACAYVFGRALSLAVSNAHTHAHTHTHTQTHTDAHTHAHNFHHLGSLPSADAAIEFLHDSTLQRAPLRHTLTGLHLRRLRDSLRRQHRRVLNALLKYAKRHLPREHILNIRGGAPAPAAAASAGNASDPPLPAYRSLSAAAFLRQPGVWWWAWHTVRTCTRARG